MHFFMLLANFIGHTLFQEPYCKTNTKDHSNTSANAHTVSSQNFRSLSFSWIKVIKKGQYSRPCWKILSKDNSLEVSFTKKKFFNFF